MNGVVRVKPGQKLRLRDVDPNSTQGVKDKTVAISELDKACRRIGELQGRLYAENRRALLVVLQGTDTSGKDGTTRNVFADVSPIGMQVHAFVAPSEEERDHDFLWRVYLRVPRRGNIGVFNRSHYEDVLVVRVRKLEPESAWKPRFDQINRFESLISSLGTRVLKIFLHIDRDEQRKRLLARLQDPAKNWKYSPSDVEDRAHWDDYQHAYEDIFERCSTTEAPWYVVPANKKWARNVLIARLVADTLEEMDPKIPSSSFDPKSVVIPP